MTAFDPSQTLRLADAWGSIGGWNFVSLWHSNRPAVGRVSLERQRCWGHRWSGRTSGGWLPRRLCCPAPHVT